MALKLKVQISIAALMCAAILLQGCAFPGTNGADAGTLQATQTPGEIPTWTPRPQDMGALPTPTWHVPATPTATAFPTYPGVTVAAPTPNNVTITVKGGNLFVRRGPSVNFNEVGVLYDGDTVQATGRDRVSRWVRVEVPSKSGVEGWITTETAYTQIDGDVSNLPFIQTEPASPAYIRNCTKTRIWILPADVILLSKYDAPYNEEQFPVGVYRVIDLDIPGTARLDDISLSEGRRVDVIYDGAGEKSKCE